MIICLVFLGLCAGTGQAATITWDNGGGDDAWTTGTNWSGDTVPGAGDDVVIPGGNTVNLSTTTSINSLDCSGTFNLSGNTFTLAATSQIQASGTFNMSGGILTGAGNLTVNGSMTWTGGTMKGSGQTIIPSGKTLAISGSNNKTLESRTLTNSGTVTFGGTGAVRLYYGPTIDNQSGGVFDVQGDVVLDHFSGDNLTFTNAGTFRRSSGTGTATVEGIFNNTGTLDVQTGTVKLTLGGGTSSGQTTTVASGATLEFGGGTHTFSTGLTVANGTVKVSNGTMRMNGTSSLAAVVVTGGTLGANAATTAQSVTLSGGYQAGTSSLTVSSCREGIRPGRRV